MKYAIKDFIRWSKANGWSVKESPEGDFVIPKELTDRYAEVPKDLIEVLRVVESCVSKGDKSWFITVKEITGKSGSEFGWNEFEQITLEAAEDDRDWIHSTVSFWNSHIPFVLSVDGEYSYYALELSAGGYRVVEGCEPEFEETTVVAKSIEEFLKLIMSGKIKL